jgi:hypothetical protein
MTTLLDDTLKPRDSWAYAFVKEHSEILAKPPQLLNPLEANTILYENIAGFLTKLQTLIERNKYHKTMIINVDAIEIQLNLKTEILIPQLEHGIPLQKSEAQLARFTIRCYEIISLSFLLTWNEHDSERNRKINESFNTLKNKEKRKFPFQSPTSVEEVERPHETIETLEEDAEEMTFRTGEPILLNYNVLNEDEKRLEDEGRQKVFDDLVESIRQERFDEGDSDEENDLALLYKQQGIRPSRAAKKAAETKMKLTIHEDEDEDDDFGEV